MRHTTGSFRECPKCCFYDGLALGVVLAVLVMLLILGGCS